MTTVLEHARAFLLTNARLLERRIFEARFEGAPPALAGQAVRAYQNPDGGLGHALEPDMRCPESQPLFAGIGLQALEEAGCIRRSKPASIQRPRYAVCCTVRV